MAFKKFTSILYLLLFSLILNAQKDKVVYTKKVFFNFNKWEIREKDKRSLNLMLKAVKAQTAPYYLSITGHTDNIDNNSYNYKLGMKRANAVAQYFIKRGVDSSKMRLYSKGEEQKAVANTSDSLRQLNRRVEILLFQQSAIINTVENNVDSTIQITLNGRLLDSATGKPLKGTILIFIKQKNRDNKLVKSFLNTDTFSVTLYKNSYEIAYSSKGYKTKNITYNFNKRLFNTNTTIQISEKLKKIKIRRKVSFDKIHFYGNEARFLPSSGGQLLRVLRLAKSKDVAAIEIVGHVNYPYHFNQNDSSQIQFNFQLSFNRAKAVYNYLVNNGVNSAIITYKGVSNTEMKYPNAVREYEMQQNRRVEVLILEESKN